MKRATMSDLTAVVNAADALFNLMGITERMPRNIDYVPRPRSIDLGAYTEQELRWMAEAQQLEEVSP